MENKMETRMETGFIKAFIGFLGAVPKTVSRRVTRIHIIRRPGAPDPSTQRADSADPESRAAYLGKS